MKQAVDPARHPLGRTVVAMLLAASGLWGLPPVTGAPAPAKKPPARPAAAPAPKPRVPAGKPADPAKNPTKPAPKPALKPDASTVFFRDGIVPRLKIQISEPDLNALRQENRAYVRCTVVENDQTSYEAVAVKLKGAAGSFRGVDDRPALTLNFDKYKKGQAFHDLDKIHLNNSVQDASYLNELVCSELFLAAGVPAARTTHARVWLNGRDLGFYVLKEGFGKDFLKHNSLDPKGNLYEGPFVQDIDGSVELDSGEGPSDRSDVRALIGACREGDPAKRWQRLEELVEIDRFLSFAALELMTCHWDGYCRNRNNYRFYFDPKSGKVQFFPHGMDQMFSDPNFNVLDGSGSLVGQAVLSNPEWRSRYRARVAELTRLFVPADRLQQRVEEHHRRLRPVLAEMGADRANQFDGEAQGLKDRLAARAQSLARQILAQEPLPLRFSPAGSAQLTRWEPRMETPDAKLERQDGSTARPSPGALVITAGPSGRCVASWRAKVLLSAGAYRFEARVRTEGVQALQDAQGAGAGIRISGSSRTNKLDGTADWRVLTHEIRIQAPTQEVELVAELRAAVGRVYFQSGSLRLVKLAE